MFRSIITLPTLSARSSVMRMSANPVVESLESRLLLSTTLLPQVKLDSHRAFEAPTIQQSADPSASTLALSTFSSSYDLRNVNGVSYVTSVKDQGQCGSCWAFATMASIESSILKAGGPAVDLSENNLKDYHGFDWGPCDGGNSWISEAYLSRLSGPVSEAQDPYHAYDDRVTPAPTYAPQYYVREMLRYDSADEIKNALMTQGALYTTMNWVDTAYRSSDYTYYYTGTGMNHAVTIVGWDDNKVTAASTSGAWLIKNSWGADWGNGGYFWLSYADSVGGKTAEAFTSADTASNYGRDYYYDTFGDVGQMNVTYAMNAFTAQANENLKSVGFFTEADGAGYSIQIYDTFSNGTLSNLLATTSGTMSTAGWHTVDLGSNVALTSGDSFYVALHLTNGGTYSMAFDYAYNRYDSACTANPGESFYSFTGTTWTDLTSYNSTANFCIKALTDNAPPPVTTGSIAGSLFNDSNGNGLRDTGETALSNWTVYLDANKNGLLDAGEKTALTDTSGNYTFADLAAGNYRVRTTLQTGWWVSAPTAGYQDVTLATGQILTGSNFGISKYVSISGTVFNDPNANGIKDKKESGLFKWRVFIDADNDGIFDTGETSVLTDRNGNWSFTNLKAGAYTIRVVQPTNYTCTTYPGGLLNITLIGGQNVTNKLFGEKKLF